MDYVAGRRKRRPVRLSFKLVFIIVIGKVGKIPLDLTLRRLVHGIEHIPRGFACVDTFAANIGGDCRAIYAVSSSWALNADKSCALYFGSSAGRISFKRIILLCVWLFVFINNDLLIFGFAEFKLCVYIG